MLSSGFWKYWYSIVPLGMGVYDMSYLFFSLHFSEERGICVGNARGMEEYSKLYVLFVLSFLETKEWKFFCKYINYLWMRST
jgi:hypothetical protein